MTFIFERTMSKRIGLILALAAVAVSAERAVGDDPPAKQANKQQTAKPADKSAERNERDRVRRDLVLKSELWKNTLAGLDQWLSVQTMYSKEEMEGIRKQVRARVEKMSADELEDFRQDLDAKLVMLLSPEGRDILDWVAANLAAAAPAYRKKMDIEYPDVARITAAQLRQQLDLLAEKRSARQTQTASLERSRQARIAGLQVEQRQAFQEREQALNRSAASASNPYRPGGVRQYPNVVSTPQFGWGFGFW